MIIIRLAVGRAAAAWQKFAGYCLMAVQVPDRFHLWSVIWNSLARVVLPRCEPMPIFIGLACVKTRPGISGAPFGALKVGGGERVAPDQCRIFGSEDLRELSDIEMHLCAIGGKSVFGVETLLNETRTLPCPVRLIHSKRFHDPGSWLELRHLVRAHRYVVIHTMLYTFRRWHTVCWIFWPIRSWPAGLVWLRAEKRSMSIKSKSATV